MNTQANSKSKVSLGKQAKEELNGLYNEIFVDELKRENERLYELTIKKMEENQNSIRTSSMMINDEIKEVKDSNSENFDTIKEMLSNIGENFDAIQNQITHGNENICGTITKINDRNIEGSIESEKKITQEIREKSSSINEIIKTNNQEMIKSIKDDQNKCRVLVENINVENTEKILRVNDEAMELSNSIIQKINESSNNSMKLINKNEIDFRKKFTILLYLSIVQFIVLFSMIMYSIFK